MKRFIELTRNFLNNNSIVILAAIQVACFITLVIIAIKPSCAQADCDKLYAKIGSGYKIAATNTLTINNKVYPFDRNSNLSARIELGLDCGRLTYGVSHHSQWLDGPPLNHREEYSITEVFVDYKFEWSL